VKDTKTFQFKIEKYTPETLPMARLAEYMHQFALLLGETKSVHFDKLTKSSAKLHANVEFDATPKVNHRLREIRAGRAPEADLKIAVELDRMLANDNTSGVVIRFPNEVMLPLLGANREKPTVYGPISQATTLDGTVIRVGGKSEPVALQIETSDGVQNYCYVTRELAKDLGKHLYGEELRFSGDGRWIRTEEGKWELVRFSIARFEVLDNASLGEVISDLRAIKGRDWADVDPWEELQDLRGNKGRET